MMEAQRLNKEVEAKKRKLQETIEKDSGKDARMDDAMDVWMVLCRREVQTRILQAISEWKQHEKTNEFGTVECCDRSSVLESVELECGWSGRRLYRQFSCRRFQCLQIGMCCLLQECFRKLDGGCWCARIVHAVRTPGWIAMPGSHRQSEVIAGVRQDGLRSCWMDS